MADNNHTDFYSDPTYTVDDILNEVRGMKVGNSQEKPQPIIPKTEIKKVLVKSQEKQEVVPDRLLEPAIALTGNEDDNLESSEDVLKNFLNRSKDHNYKPNLAETKDQPDVLFSNKPNTDETSTVSVKKHRAPHALTAEELLKSQDEEKLESFQDATIKFSAITDVQEPEKIYDESKTVAFKPVNLNDLLDAKQKFDHEENTKSAPQQKKVIIQEENENFDEEPDEEWNYEEIDDYHSVEDAEDVRIDLESRRSKLRIRFFFTLVFWTFLAGLNLLPAYISLPEFISPNTSPAAFLTANIVLVGATILFNLRSVFRGFFNIFRLRSDIDTASGIAVIAVSVQLIALYWNQGLLMSNKVFIYSSIAVLTLVFNLLGKMSMISRVKSNFDFVSNANIKQSVFIADDKFSKAINSDIGNEKLFVCCDKSVVNLQNYLYYSFSEDPADGMCKTLAPIGLVASIVCAVIVYYMTGDTMMSLSVFAAICCVCVPLTSMLASNLPLKSAAKKLKECGALMTGYRAVEEFYDVDDVVVDAEELFPAGSIDLVSLKSFGDISIDKVILDAAAVAISAGGPLSDVFDKMIEGRRKLLPKAEGIFYVDNQGIGGIVSGQNIHIGNRMLMETNEIEGLPDVEFDKRILRGSNHPIYISLNNKLIGMFILHYNVIDEDAVIAVKRMIKLGVSLLVKTTDANVTAELIEDRYEIPAGSVVILSSVSAKLYDEITAPETDGDGLLAHDNNITAFSTAITACKRLKGNIVFATILQTIGVILGFGAVFFCVLTNSLSYLSPHLLIAYQLIIAVLVLILPKFRRV